MVIDISVPASPVVKATITDFSAVDSGTLPFKFDSDLFISAVALKGTTGFAVVNGTVVTLDLSAATAPRVLASAGLDFDNASLAINGSTLIVGSGVYTIRREQARRRGEARGKAMAEARQSA